MTATRVRATTMPTDPISNSVFRPSLSMTEMAANGQIVTAETLCLRGFTRAEIERHGKDAADRATAFERGELEAA